jgi:hypothetical protein
MPFASLWASELELGQPQLLEQPVSSRKKIELMGRRQIVACCSELKQEQTHGPREQSQARPKSSPRLLLGQNIEISLFVQVVSCKNRETGVRMATALGAFDNLYLYLR